MYTIMFLLILWVGVGFLLNLTGIFLSIAIFKLSDKIFYMTLGEFLKLIFIKSLLGLYNVIDVSKLVIILYSLTIKERVNKILSFKIIGK